MGAGEPEPITEAVWHGAADEAIAERGIPLSLPRPNNGQALRDPGMLALPPGLMRSRVSAIS
jgi:hypothetical protein